MTPEQKVVECSSLSEYARYLISRHHHEILPERLWLINRIQKARNAEEFKLYKDRYDLLESMYPNKSWKNYIERIKLC